MIGPLAYIGGKRRLARRIAALIPEHVTYVEPFCGGAQVFFRKAPSRVEVLNDLDGEVFNFLRVCRHHGPELVRTLQFAVASRRGYAELAAQDPAHLTEIQRAARLLYLQKNTFGGRIVNPTFHYCVAKPSNFNPERIPGVIEAAAARLARVQLENWPYEKVLARYDRPTTFFYLDPPYLGLSLYRFNLADGEFVTLANRLSRLQGRFLLSINDTVAARATFGGFAQRRLTLAYTANRRVPQGRELLVANFALDALAGAPPPRTS